MLKTLRDMLLGGGKPAKERRRLAAPGPCPSVGASIAKRNVVMKVTEPISSEFWDWLVLSGWREVRMSKNRRKYTAVPNSAFGKLAHVAAQERDGLYRRMLGPMTTSK
jgi:hypothetical protein